MNTKLTILLLALSFFGTSKSAVAQTSLEYPGGPTSVMSDADLNALGNWARDVQKDLGRLEDDVSYIESISEQRTKLYDHVKLIAGESGLKPGDLLLRQSLYAGLVLCDMVENGRKKEKVPGQIKLQVSILKESIKMAKEYYVSDYTYLNRLMQRRAETTYNDRLIEFGVRLSKFMLKESARAQGIDIRVAYGMLKWSVGTLNRKLLDDVRNTAYASTIRFIHDELENYPDMMELTNDGSTAVKMQGLRRLVNRAFSEIEETNQALSRE